MEGERDRIENKKANQQGLEKIISRDLKNSRARRRETVCDKK